MTKKTSIWTFVFCSILMWTNAQEQNFINTSILKNARLARFNESTKFAVQVEFSHGQQNQLKNLSNKQIIKETLGLPTEFNLKLKKQEEYQGIIHNKYQQTYKNIPIEGGTYNLHQKNGLVTSINGYVYDFNKIITSPTLNENDALELAKNSYGAKTYSWEDQTIEERLKKDFDDELKTYFPKGELIIFPKGGIYQKVSEFDLAYRFDLYSSEPFGAKRIFVNAHSGEIMATRELIHTSDQKTKAKSRYSGVVEITVDNKFGLVYCLEETGRGNGIVTYDALNLEILIPVWPFCTFSLPIDLTNPRKDEAAVDAHHATETTYDYLMNEHGRNSIDGNGFKLVSGQKIGRLSIH